MKSASAILTLWIAVTLRLHHSAAEFGDLTVGSGLKTVFPGIGAIQSRIASDKNSRERRNSLTDALQAIWCDDPLTTLGCRECEKSCAKPNPSVHCAQGCHTTCICRPGLYRTSGPSPTCAPPNGPLLNNCKTIPRNVKG
ncbi:uncharacterized protein LOC129593039 [Paramacrobiotus metropolitanus]|uniref:uncharacterized protein LOC129593039 n=1 Tax=Paramacrobiotus metropolitanus TaxID=2943436 RepID=UPI0024462253|nr:uncharacterized protein LOC129593039 [Paramacrobiotus metropolitanus]